MFRFSKLEPGSIVMLPTICRHSLDYNSLRNPVVIKTIEVLKCLKYVKLTYARLSYCYWRKRKIWVHGTVIRGLQPSVDIDIGSYVTGLYYCQGEIISEQVQAFSDLTRMSARFKKVNNVQEEERTNPVN